MAEQETIVRKIPRRSYVKGIFTGQFQGKLDEKKSVRLDQVFYDLDVLRGKLVVKRENVRHYEFGEPEDFVDEGLNVTDLPTPLPATVIYPNGRKKHYRFNLKEIKIRNYHLYHQIYDGDWVYGDIRGELSGYMLHHDEEIVGVAVGETDVTVKVPPTKKAEVTEPTPPPPAVPPSANQKRTSGTFPSSTGSGWSLLRILLAILLLMVVVWAFWHFGWQALVPIGLLLIAVLLVTFSIGSALASLLLWFFRLGFILLLLGIGAASYLDWQDEREGGESGGSTGNEVPETGPVLKRDSLIAHLIEWEDYAGNAYTARFGVRSLYADRARGHREGLGYELYNEQAYNTMMYDLFRHDRDRLDSLYASFDSIRSSAKLTDQHFAEMIVSSVQSIPYVLMLPYACDARFYNDPFINRYLASDGSCVGNVSYGVYSPTEFVASLAGDCDTRTLFLYTILEHYGYRVAVMGSTYWNHSLLAINLPYAGASTVIEGRRYVLWETTAPGVVPGNIPAAQSDMSHWTVTLLSEN